MNSNWVWVCSILMGLLVACGDNTLTPVDAPPIADAPPQADAPPPIDAEPPPDAMPTELRNGTIAITEVSVSNDLAGFGIPSLAGAAVSISYLDLTTATVGPAAGTVPTASGECTVFVYDVGTNAPPDGVDEGAVTLTGAGITPDPFPVCGFFVDSEYHCFAVTPGTMFKGATTMAHTIVGGAVESTLSMVNETFQTMGARGMWASFAGFAVDFNNIAVPVLFASTEELIVVGNSAASLCISSGACTAPITDTVATPDNTHLYSVSAGAGPIPAGFDFLDDGTGDIVVNKAAGGVVPAFSATIKASGEGLALNTASPQPHEFPSTAADWTLGCGDVGGVCGPSSGTIVGFVLSGSTTDGNLATDCGNGTRACLPFEMPPPITQYAEFTCIGVPGVNDITLSQAAATAILGTTPRPTRVESRLLRITANRTSDTSGVTSIVAGHGLVGFTDIPPL